MDKQLTDKRFTTTKKVLWFLNVINTLIYISYGVSLIMFNIDLSTIVAASTTITTGFNSGYLYKAYSENKQKYGIDEETFDELI